MAWRGVWRDDRRYTWTYVSPLPWGIIVPVFFGGVLLIIVLYVEYRRRKKKRAMERCAAGPACLAAGPPRFPPAET